MADVRSSEQGGYDNLTVEENVTGHVTLILSTAAGTDEITVEVGDLARALITASPTFAKGIGEIMQRAILSALDEPAPE